MFDSIRNLFQYKAKSVKEFVGVMKREGCRTVVVRPYLSAEGGAGTFTVGVIADFQHILKFTATTPRGREVVYRERLFERFGSEYGSADAEQRCDAVIRGFLLSEQKVKELQAKLPGVAVVLIGPTGRPMDDTLYAKLHQDAATFGVSA